MPGIVNRGLVVSGRPYAEYREFLRYDFWFSCAYCSIAETESSAIGFNIDHFHPQSVPGEGINDYLNLMWSCVPCNRQKGDVWESIEDQGKGFRFLRLDEDDPRDHYEIRGIRLYSITVPGEYTIQVLNLNRKCLRDLRELRLRLGKSKAEISAGLQAIRNLRLDKLHPDQRSRFLRTVDTTQSQAARLREQSESELVVRVLNHSPLIDSDPERAELVASRREYLRSIRANAPVRGETDDK